MYISDNDKKRTLINCVFYLTASIFFALFGFVYEMFSHQVYSDFMIFAFLIPFIGGLIPFLILLFKNIKIPSPPLTQLYGSGIITLTLGSVFKGVLDIYGTTNGKIIVYPIAGFIMIVLSITLIIVNRIKN